MTTEVEITGVASVSYEQPVELALDAAQVLMNKLVEIGFSDFRNSFGGHLEGTEKRFTLKIDMKMPYVEANGRNVLDLTGAKVT